MEAIQRVWTGRRYKRPWRRSFSPNLRGSRQIWHGRLRRRQKAAQELEEKKWAAAQEAEKRRAEWEAEQADRDARMRPEQAKLDHEIRVLELKAQQTQLGEDERTMVTPRPSLGGWVIWRSKPSALGTL